MPPHFGLVEGPDNTVRPHYRERLSDCIKSYGVTVTTPHTLQHTAGRSIERGVQEVSCHFFILLGCPGVKVATVTLKVIRFAGFIVECSGNAGHDRRAR